MAFKAANFTKIETLFPKLSSKKIVVKLLNLLQAALKCFRRSQTTKITHHHQPPDIIATRYKITHINFIMT